MNKNLSIKFSILLISMVLLSFNSKCYSQQKPKNSSSKKLRFVTFKKYEIDTNKSYFHDSPNPESIKKSYLVMGDHVNPLKQVNGFYYIEFQNSNSQVSKGWISKKDVLEIDSTTQADAVAKSKPINTNQIKSFDNLLSYSDLLKIASSDSPSQGTLLSFLKEKSQDWQLITTLSLPYGASKWCFGRQQDGEIITWVGDYNDLVYMMVHTLKNHYLSILSEIKTNGFTVFRTKYKYQQGAKTKETSYESDTFEIKASETYITKFRQTNYEIRVVTKSYPH